jgi:Flp pilus assembly protein TadG
MRNERGQAMVLVVFAIIAMIAMAGLALDGGRLHTQRRQAQNAADAAAVAGARELLQIRVDACGGSLPSADAIDDAVAQAILNFTTQNEIVADGTTGDIEAWYVKAVGTDAQNVCRAGTHDLTSSDLDDITGVRVSVTTTDTTTFMKITGQDEMSTFGNAVAMVGPVIDPKPAGPVLPYAIPDEVVYDMEPGDEFLVDADGAFCKQDDPNNCSEDMADANANSQRGWLNFDYIYNMDHPDESNGDVYWRTIKSTFNAAGLKSYVSNPETVPPILPGSPPDPWPVQDPATTDYFIDGDFIVGEGGEKQSVMSEIYANYAGEIVYAPIFDLVYGTGYMEGHSPSPFPVPKDRPEGDYGWPSNFNKNSYFYHIIGFVALEVCDPDTDADCDKNEKTLKGAFETVIIGQALIDPTQSVSCNLQFNAVMLWE